MPCKNLLVGGANGGQDAAEFGRVTDHEIVRAQSRTRALKLRTSLVSKSKYCASNNFDFSNRCRMNGCAARSCSAPGRSLPPIRPAGRSWPTYTPRLPQAWSLNPEIFRTSSRCFLGKLRHLAPVVDAQFGNHGVGRQRGRIDDPGVGEDLAASARQRLVAQLLAPEGLNCSIHRKANSIFSSSCGLTGGVRLTWPLTAASSSKLRMRHVRQIEQFQEPVDDGVLAGVLAQEIGHLLGPHHAEPDLLAEPLHLGAVRRRFVRHHHGGQRVCSSPASARRMASKPSIMPNGPPTTASPSSP